MTRNPRWRSNPPKTVELVNLTPHRLNILTPDGTLVIEPSGTVARVATLTRPGPTLLPDGIKQGQIGIPTVFTRYGEIEDLPRPHVGTTFIVSGMVAALVPHRADVYSPGPLVRDDNGRPIGAQGLSRSA
jgi:hypothetical protein